MKRTIFMIMVLVFLSATPIVCATEISHHFNDPTGRSFDGNTSCTFTLSSGTYTYTCGGSAEFGIAPNTDDHIRAKLNHSDDFIYITSPIENLSEVMINFISSKTPLTGFTNIKVYISDDGVNWGDPLPEARMDYTLNSRVKAYIPKGNRYIKILNTNGSKPVYISMITYTQSDCNCFKYIPE